MSKLIQGKIYWLPRFSKNSKEFIPICAEYCFSGHARLSANLSFMFRSIGGNFFLQFDISKKNIICENETDCRKITQALNRIRQTNIQLGIYDEEPALTDELVKEILNG